MPNLREQLVVGPSTFFHDFSAKAHRLFAGSTINDLLKARKGSAADEKHVARIDLEEFLLGVLPATFRRNACYRSLNDFEERFTITFSTSSPT